MNMYTFFNLKHSSNLAVPDAATIQQILNTVATPVFEKMKLSNEKNVYRWSSDYNSAGIQTIIQFKYRATNANFLIGTNFKFMPVINSKGKIIYKKNELHLYHSAETVIDKKNEISIWNEKFFKQTLANYLKIQANYIHKYIAKSQTIPQNIDIALQQLRSTDSLYQIHDPHPQYVLSFLHAKLGEKEKAKQLMEELLATKENIPREILGYLEKV